jgi:hypothetical protein
MAYSAPLAPEGTPSELRMIKMDKHICDHLKIFFNVAYHIAKNNNPFCDFESLLEINAKLGV